MTVSVIEGLLSRTENLVVAFSSRRTEGQAAIPGRVVSNAKQGLCRCSRFEERDFHFVRDGRIAARRVVITSDDLVVLVMIW